MKANAKFVQNWDESWGWVVHMQRWYSVSTQTYTRKSDAARGLARFLERVRAK